MNNECPYSQLTGNVLKCCFEVMNEMGSGFLESVYKNALVIALQEKGLALEIEKPFQIYFRQKKIGYYIADLIVENAIVIELKCCKYLLPEHQAQTINYLAAAKLPVGLLVNFGSVNVEYKRVHHPLFYPAAALRGDPALAFREDPVI